jgi:hypothetical protein
MSPAQGETTVVKVETERLESTVHVADLLHHVHLHAHAQAGQAKTPEEQNRLLNVKRLAAELRDELRSLQASREKTPEKPHST